jgi:hypothetical protein
MTEDAVAVTAIDCSVAAVTLRETAGLEMPLNEAEIFALPTLTPVAKPPAAIVATEVVSDDQLTVAVMVFVVPSL